MRKSLVHLCLAFLLMVSLACSRGPTRDPVLADAYIGPISVDIRDELAPNAKVVATAKHGDKVEVIGTRRRFIKIRLANGKEGWTDQRRLLTVEQMQQLEQLAERAGKIPPMGRATVFDTLNMHSEPNRHSPSFYQVVPGIGVEVLARRVTERTPPPPPEPLVKPPPPKPRAKKVRPKVEPKIPPVPKPAPPKPPENWMELSRTDLPDEPEPEPKEQAPPPPKRYDDWTLVKVSNGKAGWVLSRMLIMSIPDEVAQYSEGARITSYFALGEVNDPEAGKKKHWLWTTVSDAHPPYDFDSFRVFIWNLRRHRYETSYIERGLEGYYPVQVEGPKFTVLLKGADGFYTKSFVLEGYISRWLGNAPAQAPPDPLAGLAVPKTPGAPQAPAEPAHTSMTDRVKGWFKRMTGRS